MLQPFQEISDGTSWKDVLDEANRGCANVVSLALLPAGLPITQAATTTGFYDQAHLTRHFKRIVGLTPGRYIADL